jgi:sugar lactone lactonase YvrE
VEITIGGNVADENYLLSGPSKIAVDAKGNLLVLDSKENCLKKFDGNGKHVMTFGKAGKGPGEILQAYQMAIDPKDHVVIYELGNRRFSFFNNDGVFQHAIPFKEIVWNFKIGHDGNNYVETHEWDFAGKKGGTLIKISQFSPDFAKKILVDSARIKDNTYISEPVRTNVPVPFHPSLYWDVAPSGNIVVAYSGDYTIKIYSPEVKLVKKFQHLGKRLPVASQDKENFFAEITMSSSGQSQKGAPDFIRQATEFPEFKPYFMGIKIDPEGYLLVQTYEMDKQNYIYDVFAPEGKFIGQVKLPSLGFSAIFYKSFIYALKTNEDEFPAVQRYRLK